MEEKLSILFSSRSPLSLAKKCVSTGLDPFNPLFIEPETYHRDGYKVFPIFQSSFHRARFTSHTTLTATKPLLSILFSSRLQTAIVGIFLASVLFQSSFHRGLSCMWVTKILTNTTFNPLFIESRICILRRVLGLHALSILFSSRDYAKGYVRNEQRDIFQSSFHRGYILERYLGCRGL